MLDDAVCVGSGVAAPQPWAGAMAPHAGWVYSGKLAAAVFSRIAIPDCAIILCPKHRPQGARWAVAPHRRWLFPGGELASDPELAARLADGVDGLELDAAAHRQEHAIEVQLPLLARLAPQLRVVGITVGDASLPELLRFGVAMSVVLRDMPQRPLLVVSSDMNHFADVATTRRLDGLALDAIATRDPGVRVRDGAAKPDQHVRHGAVRGRDGDAAVAGLSEPLRVGRPRHQRRRRRPGRSRRRLRGAAVWIASETELPATRHSR